MYRAAAFFLLAVLLQALLAAADDDEYEYIVVGAGSAGSIVAAKLAEAGESVLVLEAGGDDEDTPEIKDMRSYFFVAFGNTDINWNYGSVPQNIFGGDAPVNFSLPRGKVLGGSGSINAAAFVTGHKDDFDFYADEVDDRDWQWSKTRKFFTEMQKDLDIVEYTRKQDSGKEYVKSARSVLGLEYKKKCFKGKQNGICPSRWTGSESEDGGGGVRSTSYDAYLRPLVESGKVDVLPFHRVNRLLFDEESMNDGNLAEVVGVEATDTQTGSSSTFKALKEVIVCGGTYNSPQILMLSGIGPAADLEALGIVSTVDLPGVGQNLRDHYSTATFWGPGENFEESAPFLFQSPVLNFFGPEARGQTTYQFEISGTYGAVVPLQAESVGQVTLETANAADPPLIDPKGVSTENDLNALVTGLKDYLLPYFRDLVEKGFVTVAALDPNATEAEIREFVLSPGNIFSSHHPVGTCKAGTDDDNMAVVDSEFVVRGTKNLRVIDASVFPTCPSGNINAPTMAIALLGANKIIKG